eukprot:6481819-Pyramimonas_sp.AAC.1
MDSATIECLEALDENNAREFAAMKLAARRKELKEKHGIKRKRDVLDDAKGALRKHSIKTTPEWWRRLEQSRFAEQ